MRDNTLEKNEKSGIMIENIKKILQSSLLKNTGIYTITSVINSAIPFFLLPILTRSMTPEDYGLVSMFTLLVTFAAPFVGLSVNGAITRKYYERESVNIWQYVFNCFLILVGSTLLTGLVLWIFSKPISVVSAFPLGSLWMIILYSFCQFTTSIILSLWQVQKKSFFYGLFTNIQTLINFTLSIILVVGLNLGWRGRVYGQVITLAFFAALTIIILMKNKWIRVSFNKEYMIDALKFGVPLIPHALSSSIISMTDRFFITNMVGLAATGVYTAGYQIGSIINLLAVSFNNAYVPWLFEKLKEDNYNTKVKIVKFTYLYYLGIFLLACILGFLAPPFLGAFLGKSFSESGKYVFWVAVGYAFNGMYFMVVNYIFYSKETKLLTMVTFVTSIINIILNYFFIKAFGAIGASQATTVVFALKFFMVWVLAAKVYKMPWKTALTVNKS